MCKRFIMKVAARPGLEPGNTAPKAAVLPITLSGSRSTLGEECAATHSACDVNRTIFVHMLGPNCLQILRADCFADDSSANRPSTVAPLPLISAPVAPPSRITFLINSKTGNLRIDGASSELNRHREIPA